MMFLILKDRSIFHEYLLQENLTYEFKGIQIYHKNDSFYISLKEGVFFSDHSKLKKLECRRYDIINQDNYYPVQLYVYENNNGFDRYSLYENHPFLIANHKEADICCLDPYLSENYLLYKDGKLKSNFPVTVNHNEYHQEVLKNGDIICFLGIRIIWFSEFLYINSFLADNRMKPYQVIEKQLRYLPQKKFYSYTLNEKTEEFHLEDIEPFQPIETRDPMDFIRTITTNMIMSVSIGAVAILSYHKSISDGQPLLNGAIYLITPVAMFISGIILPAIFYAIERRKEKKKIQRNEDDYLSYLEAYEEEMKEKAERYVCQSNRWFFSLLNIKDNIFQVAEGNEYFLNLSLGKKKLEIPLDYKKTGIQKIDEKMKEINRYLSEMKDIPVYADLKKTKDLTILCKSSRKENFFYRFLAELSFKHHYEDIGIGIYCQNGKNLDNFYALPHLFIEHMRMTPENIIQLQEIDQKNYRKPIVFIFYDECEYYFSNPRIITIRFSQEISEVHRKSEMIVQFFDQKGFLYFKGEKTVFSFIEEEIHYPEYLHYLGSLNPYLNKVRNSIKYPMQRPELIEEYYKKEQKGLIADFSSNGQELLHFDLHEKKQGPHGLIGGSTGSGKSELIISMLLSLCARYSPEYLNIVLIDYKGGGIKDSLSYRNQTIPHICASISNLENNVLERLIIALNHECRKRQNLFKQLGKLSDQSIMNLDDYLDKDPAGYQMELLPHLLIVVDEFAELKKEHPEQIKELISLSRIGRSLGLHLILATQKPGGNIDDEIWSNSRFKISLKVFESSDSRDIIKSDDAIYLNQPGSFYLRIDDSLTYGQSFYSKSDYEGRDPFEVSVFDHLLKEKRKIRKTQESAITVAAVCCRKILELTQKNGYYVKKLDFLPMKEKERKSISNPDEFTFGISDDYLNNCRKKIVYGIDENLLIYTSRKKDILNVINTLNENKRKTLVISGKDYHGSHITDCLRYDQEEDILFLFDQLLEENPQISILIEDLNCLLTYSDIYQDKLLKIAKRSEMMDFSLICFTSHPQLNYKLIYAFRNRIMIGISDMNDLNYFFSSRCRYKGSSFYFEDEPIPFIPVICEEEIIEEKQVSSVMRKIPCVIERSFEGNRILIGYSEKKREKLWTDTKILVTSFDDSLLEDYRNAYGDRLDIKVYDRKDQIGSSRPILWLGPGLFIQRLFSVSIREDLRNDQGLYYLNGKKTVIRSLCNASDHDTL